MLSVAYFFLAVDCQPFWIGVLTCRMRKISYEKLSQLQKLILVALLEPRYAGMKRWAFNRTIKRLYYGKDSRVATSSLSRAYQRLEDRKYIARFGGRWELTDSNPYDNGVMLAFLAWGNNREFYARFGLKGPPLEALGIKPESHARPGIEVELD